MWIVFFFKQKTAYEMRISDWSSDVCSSDLLPVADEDELVDAHRRADLVKLQHIACRDHRGLVHEEHGAGEPFPRRFIARRVPFGDEALVGEDKGGDRLGLDAGALGEIADHFVLERETPDRTAFGLRDARDRLQHRGLARARLSLDRDRAIVRGEDQGRGGNARTSTGLNYSH